MRLAAEGKAWDRVVPAFVLPYATWTLYVHLAVAQQASFGRLLSGLPVASLLAIAATIGWFRLRDPVASAGFASTGIEGRPAPAPQASTGFQALPLPVLVLAILWVALLSAGMPYQVFWWGALLAMFAAWTWHLRSAPLESHAASAGTPPPWWVVPTVALAAAAVVLVAHRPAADDAFYLSIPATLLRFPQQPVLLHDTLYRLQDSPILLPFYRLANHDVLVAVVSRITGIDHLVVAYLVLPPLFAALCVFAWAYLLRRIVPARWAIVLPILFACVLLLGEAPHSYGNFAFVRMHHGKAILATCMVPVIAGAALDYARHGGLRHWLLLFAAQVAALGLAASALFVAPAAAALGLAGGWAPGIVRSRRFLLGMLPAAYLLGAAWLVGTGTHGAHALAAPAPQPMPGVQRILVEAWGPWSTRLLLVSLLVAWAFVRDPVRARYFSAGAFFLLLAALSPYTTPFVAAVSVGAKTYWRLAWALPLPFFLAVVVDGILARALPVKPKALAASACVALAVAATVFAARAGTLLCANSVTLGLPSLDVPPLEFAVARKLASAVPEGATVLAPEAVSTWLPVFVVHPRLVGVRQMYLSLAFAPAETAQRSNLMRYVAGQYRPPGADRWFAGSVRRHRLSAVVFARSAPWAGEIESLLREQGWRPISCGTYPIMVRDGPVPATTPFAACVASPATRR
jgi:hypothetical protein